MAKSAERNPAGEKRCQSEKLAAGPYKNLAEWVNTIRIRQYVIGIADWNVLRCGFAHGCERRTRIKESVAPPPSVCASRIRVRSPWIPFVSAI